MRCDVVTIFPDLILGALQYSIMQRAQERGALAVRAWNLRDFAKDKHRVVDDRPHGGGAGMVLKPAPFFEAVEAIRADGDDLRILLMSPQGRRFDQALAWEFSQETRRLVFLCGHYEGVDERVGYGLGAEEVSIGDYVLTGGEFAALVIIDAATRLVPGVLGDQDSAVQESFSRSRLDYPHFTRPAEYRGMRVAEALLSGDHEAIRRWRLRHALLNTLRKRPDLLEQAILTDEEQTILNGVASSAEGASRS